MYQNRIQYIYKKCSASLLYDDFDWQAWNDIKVATNIIPTVNCDMNSIVRFPIVCYYIRRNQ